MIKTVICLVVSYFIGNISPALMISRSKGEDIRTKGSGNAGTTNVLRNYGKKAAVLTLVIDILKGVVSVNIGRFVGGEKLCYLCALAVMVGHIWPALHGFKGGKGVAASIGAIAAASPFTALIIAVFALAIMAASKMVSLGSVCAAAALPVVSYFTCRGFVPAAAAMAAIVIFKHRSNIQRILSGTESKLDFSKYK